MSTRAKVREAARAQATRSGRVPQSAIDAELEAFNDKDLRLWRRIHRVRVISIVGDFGFVEGPWC